MADSFHPDVDKTRFLEPIKFLPVAFVGAIISILWCIYMAYHCFPLLQGVETHHQGLVHSTAFNLVTTMLVVCYVRCILTHPGTVPGQGDAGASAWEYKPPDPCSPDALALSLQETKRTGDRRHCKWCNKYKPDRCHHCRVCRTCILRMDHHCPWIYNCVGFRNHKFFFLLLFYSVIACQIITFSMYESLKDAISPGTSFLKMFLLLFGETLAVFFGFMVTTFFCFHIWLMVKAMTTIEFCEKSMKRTGYDSNAYDRGLSANLRAVLGENPFLWPFPFAIPLGDGLSYISEEAPLLRLSSQDVDASHGIFKNTTHKHKGKKNKMAGTGECSGSESSGQQSDTSARHDPPKPFEEQLDTLIP